MKNRKEKVWSHLQNKVISRFVLLIAIVSVSVVAGFSQTAKFESLYVDFGDKNCKELKDRAADGILYVGECRGIAGYKLMFYETEHHQSLAMLAPDGTKFALPMDISAAPSYLGKVAEWRVRRVGETVIPTAMIVRLNVFGNGSDPDKTESFLLVTKITKDVACVVDKIPPIGMDQNDRARSSADTSAEKPCLENVK